MLAKPSNTSPVECDLSQLEIAATKHRNHLKPYNLEHFFYWLHWKFQSNQLTTMDTKWKSWNSETDVIPDVMLKVWYIWQTLEQQILNKYLYKYLQKLLHTFLLQNNKELKLSWVTTFYLTSMCQFSLKIWNSIVYFSKLIEKKSVFILKVMQVLVQDLLQSNLS